MIQLVIPTSFLRAGSLRAGAGSLPSPPAYITQAQCRRRPPLLPSGPIEGEGSWGTHTSSRHIASKRLRSPCFLDILALTTQRLRVSDIHPSSRSLGTQAPQQIRVPRHFSWLRGVSRKLDDIITRLSASRRPGVMGVSFKHIKCHIPTSEHLVGAEKARKKTLTGNLYLSAHRLSFLFFSRP